MPGLSAVSCPVSTLAPSASTTCTASYTVTQTDIDNGSIANTATATGSPPVGPPVTDTGSTTVTAPTAPGITIVKSTTAPPYSAVGQVLSFTLTTTNTGNVTLTNVIITDAFAVVGACTPVAPATLAPGGTITCGATHVVTQADLNFGHFDNSASVSGVTPTSTTVTDDSNLVVVPAVQTPRVTVSKTTTATEFSIVGQQIPFTITVVNTGNITLTDVVITDPNAAMGMCTPVLPVANLAPGQSITCGAVHTVNASDVTAASISNTAFVAARSGLLDVTGASNIVVVPGMPSIGIPRTGASTLEMLDMVAYLLVGGLLLLFIAKRRRRLDGVLDAL